MEEVQPVSEGEGRVEQQQREAVVEEEGAEHQHQADVQHAQHGAHHMCVRASTSQKGGKSRETRRINHISN